MNKCYACDNALTEQATLKYSSHSCKYCNKVVKPTTLSEQIHYVWYHTESALSCNVCYFHSHMMNKSVVSSCKICGQLSDYKYGITIEIDYSDIAVILTACSKEHLSLLFNEVSKPRKGYCSTCDIHYKGARIFVKKPTKDYSLLLGICLGLVCIGMYLLSSLV